MPGPNRSVASLFKIVQKFARAFDIYVFHDDVPEQFGLGPDDGPLVAVRNSAISVRRATSCRTLVSRVPLRAAWIV